MVWKREKLGERAKRFLSLFSPNTKPLWAGGRMMASRLTIYGKKIEHVCRIAASQPLL